mgnify:FL=1
MGQWLFDNHLEESSAILVPRTIDEKPVEDDRTFET